MRSPFAQNWGRSGFQRAAPPVPYAQRVGGKTPEILGDFVTGLYAIKGSAVAFDSLFSFSRTSAAWKLNALGHWVKALAGEPRTGHHVWKGGKLVPAGIAVCSAVRTNLPQYSSDLDNAQWNPGNEILVAQEGVIQGVPAFRLSDNNLSGYANLSQPDIQHNGSLHTCQILVEKDDMATSYLSLRLFHSVEGVTTFSGASINPATGGNIKHWESSSDHLPFPL